MSQAFQSSIRQWTQEDGLLHREVNVIYEDRLGFIWLGYNDGIQRFDGHYFKSWTKNNSNHKLYDITRLGEDDGNWLWLWNSKIDEFIFLNTVTQQIQSESERFGNDLIIKSRTRGGNWVYQEDRIPSDSNGSLVFLLSQPNRIMKFSVKKGLSTTPILSTNKKENYVLKFLDSENHLWACSESDNKVLYKISDTGIILATFRWDSPCDFSNFHESSGTIYFNRNSNNNTFQERYTHSTLKTVKKISEKKRWTRFHGEYIWEQESLKTKVFSLGGQIQIAEINDEKFSKILYSSRTDLLEDNKGRVWWASPYGLAVSSVKPNHFTPYFNSDKDKYSARAMVEKDSIVYVNTESKGIIKINTRTKTSIVLKNSQNFSGIPLAHHDSYLFSGSGRLIFKLALNDNGVTLTREISTKHKFIWSFFAENDTLLYYGTESGLSLVNLTTLEHSDLCQNLGKVYQITKTDDDKFWLCSATGLHLYDVRSNKIELSIGQNQELQIPAQEVYTLHTNGEEFWLGTEGGLVDYDLKNKEYKIYNKQNGFSNQKIYGICEDLDGYFWLTTDFGLICFNKTSKANTSFLTKDGLTHNEFNRTSFLKLKNGNLAFGGLNGIITFDPVNVSKNLKSIVPQLLISDVSLYDDDFLRNITGEVVKSKRITLPPSYKYLLISLAFPNFEDDYLNQYAWKIEGEDEDWKFINGNILQLGKLTYGDKRLHIKAIDSNGNTDMSSIELIVNKPFYFQYWFLALMLLALISVAYLYMRIKTNRLRNNERKLQIRIDNSIETIKRDKQVIEKQAEELQKLDTAKSQFFENISHEMRTPLTLILGPLQNVLTDNEVRIPSKIKNLLAISLKNSKKLQDRVEELLDLSKLEAGTLKLNPIAVSIAPLIEQEISEHRLLGKSNRIKIRFQNKLEKQIVVLLDADKTIKVLDNLLSNAIKHSPERGIIDVTLKKEKNQYRLRVSDEGKGINPAQAIDIFNRFFQTEEGMNKGGVGIGLAMSYSLAKLLGGDLVLDTTYTNGASFVFSFPAAETTKIPLITETKPVSPVLVESNHTSSNRPKILVVEDNEQMRAYIRSVLSNDFQIFEAENGLEALDFLKLNTIDLITTDVMMPKMDGISFFKALKKESIHPIPTIVISAKSEQDHLVKALKLGIDDYLIKPFYGQELIARILTLLRRTNVRVEHKEDSVSQKVPLVGKIKKEVLKNCSSNNYTVSKLCDKLSTTEKTLNRKLKKEIGLSAAAFIKEIRLNEALKLLQKRSYSSVKEVSIAVGFKRQDYFAKEFHKRYGKYPKEYLI